MRDRRSNAFTILELILVLVILCTVLATAAPSMSGWSRGSRLRDAGDQLLALTRFARTQAIAESRTYRLNIDSQAGRYWLTAQDGLDFTALGSEWGRIHSVPEGFSMQVIDGQGAGTDAVDFFANGRTQPAHIRISAGDAYAVELQCITPAESFVIVSPRGEP
jgi:type II secretion system protein H